MILTRRGFLAGLASIPVAVAAGDALWVPGRKVISLPSPGFASLSEEMTYIVRRAFVPQIVLNIGKNNALLSELMVRADRLRQLDALVADYMPTEEQGKRIMEIARIDSQSQGRIPLDLPMVGVDIWGKA